MKLFRLLATSFLLFACGLLFYQSQAHSSAAISESIEVKAALLEQGCREITPGNYECKDASYDSTSFETCLSLKNSGVVFGCEPKNLLTVYADKIEEKLKGKPIGYAFVVTRWTRPSGSNFILPNVARAFGWARLAQDAPAKQMSVDTKFNVASVSKTVTAAAVMRLLTQNKISVDALVQPYLPSDWTLGKNFKTITFRELLTHKAGIRCATEVTHTNMRKCVAFGVNLDDKKIAKYNNSNFALFRYLIPHLNGFKGGATANNSIAETIASGTYATLYMDYVRKEVFAKTGVKSLDCRPTDGTNQGLAYKLSAFKGNGTDFGDMTETNASRGWFMSARDLSKFFYGLHYTEAVVPRAVSAQMRNELLGYDGADSYAMPAGTTRYWKGGFYPGANNPGEMNTLILGFTNGVQLSIIINSDLPAGLNYGQAVTDAMAEALK